MGEETSEIGFKLRRFFSFKRKKERGTNKGDNKIKRRPDSDGQVVAGVLSRPVITVQIVLFSLSIVNKGDCKDNY